MFFSNSAIFTDKPFPVRPVSSRAGRFLLATIEWTALVFFFLFFLSALVSIYTIFSLAFERADFSFTNDVWHSRIMQVSSGWHAACLAGLAFVFACYLRLNPTQSKGD